MLPCSRVFLYLQHAFIRSIVCRMHKEPKICLFLGCPWKFCRLASSVIGRFIFGCAVSDPKIMYFKKSMLLICICALTFCSCEPPLPSPASSKSEGSEKRHVHGRRRRRKQRNHSSSWSSSKRSRSYIRLILQDHCIK